MNDIQSATVDAFGLLLSGDHQLWSIVFTSLSVSLRALTLATPIALLIAFALAYLRFPGQRLLVTLFNTLMAVPAVVVGLVLYILLSAQGPAGELRLLFTPSAMIIGQFLLCLPLMVALAHASFRAGDQRAWESALTLGAHPWRALVTVIHELRFGLLAAVLAGFGRVIAEVGCSMMVGGNILYHTRNITTAIALETSKGAFSSGVALGLVLLLLALGLNLALAWLQGNSQVTS